jgi:hypothetical protein
MKDFLQEKCTGNQMPSHIPPSSLMMIFTISYKKKQWRPPKKY